MTTIKLSKPINHDGKTYEAIEIEEPSVAAVAAYEKATRDGGGETEAAIAMLSIVGGIPAEAISLMKISDFTKTMEALAPFMEAQKPVGGDTGAPSVPTSATS